MLWRDLTKVISIPKLEVQGLTCPGPKLNPGLPCGRRALTKSAIRTAYAIAVGTSSVLLISQQISVNELIGTVEGCLSPLGLDPESH